MWERRVSLIVLHRFGVEGRSSAVLLVVGGVEVIVSIGVTEI